MIAGYCLVRVGLSFRFSNASNTILPAIIASTGAADRVTTLNAERASARASREVKREAVSEFLPTVTVSGYVSEQENTNPGDDTNFRPSEQSITVEQKIFQGFSGVANLKKKKHGQTLAEFQLKKIEQENSEIDMTNDVENSEVTEDTTSLSEPMNVSEVEETEINTIEADEVSETIDTIPETETAIQEENDTKE